MKKEFFVVLLGIIVCSCFGFGYLFLFSDQPILSSNEVANTTIHIYTNQVGVYSNQENAIEAGNTLSSLSEPYYILEKNDQYVLLSLITVSEEEMTSQKSKLVENGFTVFTKEYDVASNFQSCFDNNEFSELITELESR